MEQKTHAKSAGQRWCSSKMGTTNSTNQLNASARRTTLSSLFIQPPPSSYSMPLLVPLLPSSHFSCPFHLSSSPSLAISLSLDSLPIPLPLARYSPPPLHPSPFHPSPFSHTPCRPANIEAIMQPLKPQISALVKAVLFSAQNMLLELSDKTPNATAVVTVSFVSFFSPLLSSFVSLFFLYFHLMFCFL